MVRKLKTILAIIILVFAIPMAAHATMALAWDAYTDSTATFLRLESSIDSTFATLDTLVDSIATNAIGVAVPNHTEDNERVYYRLVAYNATDTSDPSNPVSYYWTTGGGGQEGLQTPGNINFVDCTKTTDQAEIQFCIDLGIN